MMAFVSTMLYALGKEHGMVGALRQFQRQMTSPGKESLPVVRTIYRLQQMTDVRLWVDCGATCIAKGRSRAFHEARKSDCSVWVTIDDDIEASTTTVGSMLEVLEDSEPRVVVVPYMQRSADSVHPRLVVDLPLVRADEWIAGAKLCPLRYPAVAGFGMVGMNRTAMERIGTSYAAKHGEQAWFTDEDTGRKLAVFREIMADGKWYGEDLSFFRAIPDDIKVSALLVGSCSHAGVAIDLEQL